MSLIKKEKNRGKSISEALDKTLLIETVRNGGVQSELYNYMGCRVASSSNPNKRNIGKDSLRLKTSLTISLMDQFG